MFIVLFYVYTCSNTASASASRDSRRGASFSFVGKVDSKCLVAVRGEDGVVGYFESGSPHPEWTDEDGGAVEHALLFAGASVVNLSGSRNIGACL